VEHGPGLLAETLSDRPARNASTRGGGRPLLGQSANLDPIVAACADTALPSSRTPPSARRDLPRPHARNLRQSGIYSFNGTRSSPRPARHVVTRTKRWRPPRKHATQARDRAHYEHAMRLQLPPQQPLAVSAGAS